MNALRHWKIMLSLAALFALGMATGSVLTSRLRPEPAVALQPPEEKWRALTLADYEQRLSLTPDQVQRLKPIFAVTGDKLRTLRANTPERVSELIREMNQQMMPALDAEQQTKLKTLLEERRKAKAEGRSQ
jgi:hypothetical protein